MFGQVINRIGNFADFGHKTGKGFGKRAAHPHPICLPSPGDKGFLASVS